MKPKKLLNGVFICLTLWWMVSMIFFGAVFRLWLGPAGFLTSVEMHFGSGESIAIAPDKSVYITCQFMSRVQKYDDHGRFQYAINFGHDGDCEINTDDAGNLYVCLFRDDVVRVYDGEGNLVKEMRVETGNKDDILLGADYGLIVVEDLQKDGPYAEYRHQAHPGEPVFPVVEQSDVFVLGDTKYYYKGSPFRAGVLVDQGDGAKALFSSRLLMYFFLLPLLFPNMLLLIFVVMPFLFVTGLAQRRKKREARKKLENTKIRLEE